MTHTPHHTTPHHTTQVIQAAKISGARRIIAIDTNPAKFSSARAMGASDCVDPTALDVPIQQHIVAMTQVSFFFLRAPWEPAIEVPSKVQILSMT
jgi:Zn-dependent alcohol dehydrogenase